MKVAPVWILLVSCLFGFTRETAGIDPALTVASDTRNYMQYVYLLIDVWVISLLDDLLLITDGNVECA